MLVSPRHGRVETQANLRYLLFCGGGSEFAAETVGIV